MPLLETLQIAVALLTLFSLLGGGALTIHGIYRGWLFGKIRAHLDLPRIEGEIEHIRQNTQNLEMQHEETMEEIQTVKHGQIAIAETVADEHNGVRVEELREAHFGNRERPADFRYGGSFSDDD